jgi:hypothetical protein
MFGLDFINKLKPCKWRYKDLLDDGLEHLGFIAQEVDAVAPHYQYGIVCKDANDMLAIQYTELIGPLVKAVQELNEKVIELEAQLQEVKDADHGV